MDPFYWNLVSSLPKLLFTVKSTAVFFTDGIWFEGLLRWGAGSWVSSDTNRVRRDDISRTIRQLRKSTRGRREVCSLLVILSAPSSWNSDLMTSPVAIRASTRKLRVLRKELEDRGWYAALETEFPWTIRCRRLERFNLSWVLLEQKHGHRLRSKWRRTLLIQLSGFENRAFETESPKLNAEDAKKLFRSVNLSSFESSCNV